jgi:hypothetical protein
MACASTACRERAHGWTATTASINDTFRLFYSGFFSHVNVKHTGPHGYLHSGSQPSILFERRGTPRTVQYVTMCRSTGILYGPFKRTYGRSRAVDPSAETEKSGTSVDPSGQLFPIFRRKSTSQRQFHSEQYHHLPPVPLSWGTVLRKGPLTRVYPIRI